jgi:hypothetical protein
MQTCHSKISSLLEVVWQHNWLFVGSGLVAKIAGGVAELAPRFSGRNLGNGFALFGIGLAAIILGRLCHHTSNP